jgi:hypothetical protein
MWVHLPVFIWYIFESTREYCLPLSRLIFLRLHDSKFEEEMVRSVNIM